MPPRTLRESLKRRREGYQLSLHHYAELKRQKYNRVETPDEAESVLMRHTGTATTCPSGAQATANPFLAHSDCYARSASTSPPLSMSAATATEFAAAMPVSTGGMGGSPPHDKQRHGAGNAVGRCATSSLQTSNDTGSSPSQHGSENDSNRLVLRLRPVCVDVMRGDTGRRCTFLLQSTFQYVWHRGNHFYRSLDGEQVGLEVQETVLCQVAPLPTTPPPSMPQEHPLSLNAATPASAWPLSGASTATTARTTIETSYHGLPECDHYAHALLHNDEAAAAAAAASITPHRILYPSYSYEATQVSRRLLPPSRPDLQSSDPLVHMGSCSPALFVECLLKCVHDEAALSDDHGWVYLYHGRHVLTEMGCTRLLHDLFAQAYFESSSFEGDTQPSLTVCVFRKY